VLFQCDGSIGRVSMHRFIGKNGVWENSEAGLCSKTGKVGVLHPGVMAEKVRYRVQSDSVLCRAEKTG